MPEIMNLKSISKSYGKILALEDISLSLNEGEILVLLGPNGSGKSTLVRIIASLIQPDAGEIYRNGYTRESKKLHFYSQLGLLFDLSIHWDKLSGYENAWFFAKNYGLSNKDASVRLEELFKWSNLWEKKDDLVQTYSFGMKRKLALIETLIHKPKLLLLDEPTMGLDYKSRIAFYTLLKNEAEKGTSIVLATNDVNEAAFLAHKVAFMDKGRILLLDTPKNLMNSLETFVKIEITLALPIDLTFLKEISDIQYLKILENEVNQFKAEILLKPENLNNSTGILARIINLIAVNRGILLNFNIKNPSLGDIFIKLTGD